MKLCFPVKEVTGLESKIYGHFGSAPFFIVVDMETHGFVAIDNHDQNHAHGMCSPLKALAGKEIDAVIVGGIGGGALMKLNASGINVYKAAEGTITENLALFSSGDLPPVSPGHACGGHGHGGQCSH